MKPKQVRPLAELEKKARVLDARMKNELNRVRLLQCGVVWLKWPPTTIKDAFPASKLN